MSDETTEAPKRSPGRPRREDRGKVAKQCTFKLYQEDIERLSRLAEVYGSKTEALRLALDALEAMPTQGERAYDET